MWGIDILGPFPQATGQRRWLVVAVDYFTKWIEATPITAITADGVEKFLWKEILCRHGQPSALVSDNGTQFASVKIADFCEQYGIKQIFSSVEHPQTNGQAEAANKVILTGLQKRLDNAKAKWAEELPAVLWSYHTTVQKSTLETPFRLTYGYDAVIPIENLPSSRIQSFDPMRNEEEMRAELDTLEEAREVAKIRQASTKAMAARGHNTRLIP
jgi:transposase InsO family protein